MRTNRETITIRVNSHTKEKLKDLAKTSGSSGMSELVRKLIEDRLDRRGSHL